MIFLEQLIYQDAWHSSGEAGQVNFLLSNIGEQIIIYIDYRIEIVAIASEDNEIIFAPDPNLIDSLQNENVIFDPAGIAFQDFNVGDQIQVVGTSLNNGSYTITEKIDDGFIRCGSVFTNEEAPTDSYVAVTSQFSGLRYYWNFIENDNPANFESLVDGETQLLKTNDADAEEPIPVTMLFNGIKSYQIGSCLLSGQGIDEYAQRFRILHNTTITPHFLFNQLNDLIARVAPEYYLDGKCLKHVFRLECSRTLNDPNPAQVFQLDDRLGNSGWFNENYNGGQSKFAFSDLQRKRVSDNEPIPGFQIDQASEYNFKITASDGATFQNANTRVVVNFCYLPEDESQYQNNGRTLKENYVLDRASFKLGAATVAGENNLTTLQVITQAQAIFVSSTEITVRVRVDLGTLAKSIIEQGDFRRYIVWVTTETYGLLRNTSDKVSLLIDVNEFFEDLEDTNIVSATSKFLIHTQSDPETEGQDFCNAFPGDDIVCSTNFNIDYFGGEPILINKIEAGIVLKKTGELDIELEKFSFDTSSSSLEGGLVPSISINQDRVFKIPDDEIRKKITIDRRPDLDTGTIKFWTINYGFMHRWEYWKPLGILTDLPAGIFDPTKPLNGINHFWHRYTTISGWKIYHRLRFVVEFAGNEFEQFFDIQYNSMDYDSNPEWDNESEKSYNLLDIELVNGGNKLLQGFEYTKVIASFEKVDGDLPDVADVDIVFRIGRKELDGIDAVRRASSKYELDPGSWFKSIDTSNKVVVENPSAGIYTGTILVDNTKIPQFPNFTIQARIYDPSDVTPDNAKITEDGDIKITEAGDIKIVELVP